MKRIEAIKKIMNSVTDEIVVSSCGKISREVYAVRDRPKNFYVQGSMSASLGIGIGLAINLPNRRIVVISGDGEVLMSLGSLVLLNKLNLKNIEIYILDNNQYQSTGGQKNCSNAIDFRYIYGGCKVIFCTDSKEEVPRIDIPHSEIRRRFMEAIDDRN